MRSSPVHPYAAFGRLRGSPRNCELRIESSRTKLKTNVKKLKATLKKYSKECDKAGGTLTRPSAACGARRAKHLQTILFAHVI